MTNKKSIEKKKRGVYTIGYGRTEVETFICTLIKARVNLVVDVRSIPYSKYNPEYKKENLEKSLKKSNIEYLWMECLGGSPKDKKLYDKDGVVNYSKIASTNSFKNGIKQLEELAKTNNVAIMCAEENPLECHRFLLISREIVKNGLKVVHIGKGNVIMSQQSLESELVKIYYGSHTQIEFSTSNDLSPFDLVDKNLNESYIKQNKRYGKRLKK
jgi:uncharacterized protein (DUF488 family)